MYTRLCSIIIQRITRENPCSNPTSNSTLRRGQNDYSPFSSGTGRRRASVFSLVGRNVQCRGNRPETNFFVKTKKRQWEYSQDKINIINSSCSMLLFTKISFNLKTNVFVTLPVFGRFYAYEIFHE